MDKAKENYDNSKSSKEFNTRLIIQYGLDVERLEDGLKRANELKLELFPDEN